MRLILFLSFLASSFLSWGECSDINISAEQKKSLNSTAESNYIVKYKSRVCFYSAPDEMYRIKDIFIIKNDVVSVYAEYKDFY